MEPFKIHILGCGSATPRLQHFPSSQVVEVRGKVFMVDCAEGTQLQLRKTRVAFTKIQAVFISHMHGDHCFGLIGMVSTFGLLGRTAPLHIYAPAAMEEYLMMQKRLFCKDWVMTLSSMLLTQRSIRSYMTTGALPWNPFRYVTVCRAQASSSARNRDCRIYAVT